MKFIIISVAVFFLILSGTFLVFGYSSDNYEGEHLENILSFFNGGELNNNYTETEVIHLQDVKNLMVLTKFIFFAALIVLGLGLWFIKDFDVISKGFFYGGLSFLVVIVAFLVTTMIDFRIGFDFFHQMLFRNDYWILPDDSFLLSLFPITYFKKLFFEIVVFSGVLSFICLLQSRLCPDD